MSEHVLQITSGVGPAEARRFVFQLAAWLEQVCVARGLRVGEVVATGDDGAPRSVSLHLHGDALGLLADQQGTHVLIDRSRDRGRSSRKRWFAAVTLHAHTPAPPAHLDGSRLARDELVITACRAGGPGGQHVNKVATAVRIQHLPTGLSVRCASDRSQQANLDRALARLAALLQQRVDADRARDDHQRRRAHYQLVRGHAVRTYTRADDGALVERAP